MKKKLYSLLAAVVILALLFGLYMFLSSRNNDETNEAEVDDISLSDLGTQLTAEEDVNEFTLKNNNGEFVFVKDGDNWTIKNYDNLFDQSVINKIAAVFSRLYAQELIEENVQDLSKYSLDSPAATAISGNTQINIGSATTDGKYNYVNINGSSDVYMVNSANISCLEYGLNDLIDKSLSKIDSDTIQELTINYKDKDNIVIKYESDNPLAREYSEQNGLATLIMEEPVENMLVYPYNLQSSVLMNLDSLNISELADIAPKDLSLYGLDSPNCTFYIADNDNNISVKVGAFVPDTDNTYSYVMVNDRPEVFTMEYRALSPFVNASIADFVEKFISLYQRSKVNEITINGDKTYTIEFKAEGENDFREIDGVTKDYRNSYINGKLVDKDTFTDFYELIVGIGFDNIVNTYTPSGSPALSITFDLSDGTQDTANYYDYDNSFYVVNKGDDVSMLVSKQTVRKVLSEAENLSK